MDDVMFRVSPPGRRLVGVVVPAEGPCSACRVVGRAMVLKLLGGSKVTVCQDEQACRDRIVLAVLDGEL